MKWNKIIAVLTSVLLMFCMTACGSSTNGNNGKGKVTKALTPQIWIGAQVPMLRAAK